MNVVWHSKHVFYQDMPNFFSLPFSMFSDSAQSMRFGLDLCSEEKVYLQQRRPKVLAGLSAFLGNKDDNPQSVSEVHKYIHTVFPHTVPAKTILF